MTQMGPKSGDAWLRRRVETVTLDQVDEAEENPVPGQVVLFAPDDEFRVEWQHWRGMPEMATADQRPLFRCVVNFASEEDLRAFERLIDQKITRDSVKSIWYPRLVRRNFKDSRWRSTLEDMTI